MLTEYKERWVTGEHIYNRDGRKSIVIDTEYVEGVGDIIILQNVPYKKTQRVFERDGWYSTSSTWEMYAHTATYTWEKTANNEFLIFETRTAHGYKMITKISSAAFSEIKDNPKEILKEVGYNDFAAELNLKGL